MFDLSDSDLIKQIRAEILTSTGVKVAADDPILINAIVVEKMLDRYKKQTEELTDEIICKNLTALDSSLENKIGRMEEINKSYVDNTQKFLTVFSNTIKELQEKEVRNMEVAISKIKTSNNAGLIFSASIVGAVVCAAITFTLIKLL